MSGAIYPLPQYASMAWCSVKAQGQLSSFSRIEGTSRVYFIFSLNSNIGSSRKLHNDELHSPYSSPNIVRVIKSRKMRWAGHVACMGEGRGVYKVLVGRLEGKRPLGRPRRRGEDNIKMDLREIGIDMANWIQLAQERVQWRACVNTVMNLRVP
jgi:hypothetical protein